ncbi:MAG: IS5 family transposase [Oligoflexales bacterium]|nr:IS5 family transposase [Oligoflexales bacterium]
MNRTILTDDLWEKLRKMIEFSAAYLTDNLRFHIEGILWRFRTGTPWCDLPDIFEPWKTIFNLFNDWSKSDVWHHLFLLIRGELDTGCNFMDGTYIKVHQHAAGSVEPKEMKTIGMSRGGNTTKVHMMAEGKGNPVDFKLNAGNINDSSLGAELIAISDGYNIIGVKGYDSETLRDLIQEKGSTPHIPRKANSTKQNYEFNNAMYRHRHLIENLFARLKHFRAFATHYYKLTRNYCSVVSIARLVVWLKL